MMLKQRSWSKLNAWKEWLHAMLVGSYIKMSEMLARQQSRDANTVLTPFLHHVYIAMSHIAYIAKLVMRFFEILHVSSKSVRTLSHSTKYRCSYTLKHFKNIFNGCIGYKLPCVSDCYLERCLESLLMCRVCSGTLEFSDHERHLSEKGTGHESPVLTYMITFQHE